MRKYLYISTILILILGLNSCKVDFGECFKDGERIKTTIDLNAEPFSSIIVYDDVKLIVKHDSTFNAKIDYLENRIDDINLEVKDGVLEIKNSNKCNLIKSPKYATVTISAPNLSSIRNSSIFSVKSEGVLKYEDLAIIVEDWNSDVYNNVGDFDLQIENKKLKIVANGFSDIILKGSTDYLGITFASFYISLDAREFTVKDVNVLHRSAKDIIIGPSNSIKGKITSSGNIILTTRPAIVEIEETYRGKVIYE
jgi:hypothetical protein